VREKSDLARKVPTATNTPYTSGKKVPCSVPSSVPLSKGPSAAHSPVPQERRESTAKQNPEKDTKAKKTALKGVSKSGSKVAAKVALGALGASTKPSSRPDSRPDSRAGSRPTTKLAVPDPAKRPQAAQKSDQPKAAHKAMPIISPLSQENVDKLTYEKEAEKLLLYIQNCTCP
jgi:hypothetical protein